jgi:hypothetical protein
MRARKNLPRAPGKAPIGGPTPSVNLGLKVGELVGVKSDDVDSRQVLGQRVGILWQDGSLDFHL